MAGLARRPGICWGGPISRQSGVTRAMSLAASLPAAKEEAWGRMLLMENWPEKDL